MSRAVTLTRHLKRYDSELYASEEWNHYVDDSTPLSPYTTRVIYVLRRNRSRPHEPHFIFALTEDWSVRGRPREWGIEVILARIRAMDLWKDETVFDRFIKQQEITEASEKRAERNNIESFLLEFRKDFAKATDGINTSTLPKTDFRRKADLKYGS